MLAGRPLVAGEFEFKVTNTEDAPKVGAPGTNDAEGTIACCGTTESTEKLSATGSVAGVTTDPVDPRTSPGTVTDNGDGTLSVDTRAESDATDFTFTNTCPQAGGVRCDGLHLHQHLRRGPCR